MVNLDGIDQIIEELLADEARWLAEAQAAIDDLDDPAERLAAMLASCAKEWDAALWLHVWRAAPVHEGAATARRECDVRFRGIFERVLADGQADGSFELDSAAGAALALAALVDGLAMAATVHDWTVSPGYMLGALMTAGSRIVSKELPEPPAGSRRASA